MRDPKRIGEILVALGTVWDKYPDMRFFQLLEHLATLPREGNPSPFYWEDADFLKFLEDQIKSWEAQ